MKLDGAAGYRQSAIGAEGFLAVRRKRRSRVVSRTSMAFLSQTRCSNQDPYSSSSIDLIGFHAGAAPKLEPCADGMGDLGAGFVIGLPGGRQRGRVRFGDRQRQVLFALLAKNVIGDQAPEHRARAN